MDKDVKYYLISLPGFAEEKLLVRFFSESGKLPERYSVHEGWTQDKEINLWIMDGSIAGCDRITEIEALKLLEK